MYEDRKKHEETLKEHHDSVSRKKEEYNSDIKEAKESNGQIKCYTFDLQKTLETPSLSTSVAYYKRKLWTFNLCIYNEVTGKGYMYMWSENVASRGAHEIGSCVIKHLQTYDSDNTKKVYLYSDSCGGQNRNIKITLMLKKVLNLLNNADIYYIITQKYFISGQSYNSCDRSFATIEKQRTVTSEVYTPKHWCNIVQLSKKKEPNTKINWLNIDTIEYKKHEPFKLYLKVRNDQTQYVVNLHKNGVTKQMFADATMPVSKENMIDKKKYLDLIALLKFIPEQYHDFFKSLKCEQDQNEEIIDFGLASDGEFDEFNEEECKPLKSLHKLI